MEVWVYLAKNTHKAASQYTVEAAFWVVYHPGTLEAVVRYNQAQKCFQYDSKCFQ